MKQAYKYIDNESLWYTLYLQVNNGSLYDTIMKTQGSIKSQEDCIDSLGSSAFGLEGKKKHVPIIVLVHVSPNMS